MPKHEVTLLNGEKVSLNTSISLFQLKKSQEEGLISKTFLGDLMKLEHDPSQFDINAMIGAPYIAYRNANPNPMSVEKFELQFPNDIELIMELYAEIISGNAKSFDVANQFKKKTKNKKKAGKPFPESKSKT